jgi:hypothetical protein
VIWKGHGKMIGLSRVREVGAKHKFDWRSGGTLEAGSQRKTAEAARPYALLLTLTTISYLGQIYLVGYTQHNAYRNTVTSEQVWACVRVDSAPAGAVCPSPPDLACYVYDEEKGAFSYWGRNSALRLTIARRREVARRLHRTK